MSSYYDAFGSSSIESDDPYADELELERRDAEMGDDEPDYDSIDNLDWSDLNDEAANINIITGEVEE